MAEATGNETVSDVTRAHSTPLNVPVDVPESEVIVEFEDSEIDSDDSDDSED